MAIPADAIPAACVRPSGWWSPPAERLRPPVLGVVPRVCITGWGQVAGNKKYIRPRPARRGALRSGGPTPGAQRTVTCPRGLRTHAARSARARVPGLAPPPKGMTSHTRWGKSSLLEKSAGVMWVQVQT